MVLGIHYVYADWLMAGEFFGACSYGWVDLTPTPNEPVPETRPY